jgi:hypothetical protein
MMSGFIGWALALFSNQLLSRPNLLDMGISNISSALVFQSRIPPITISSNTELKSDKKVIERLLTHSNFRCLIDSGVPFIPKRLVAYELYLNSFLVKATCFPPQYNGVYQFILYTENFSQQQTKIIPFNTLDPSLLESGKIHKTELLTISGISEFFPEDNVLRDFNKGIGAGGCGYAAEYRLIEEKFELQEFRKYDCYSSGVSQPFKSPEEFPKIYP